MRVVLGGGLWPIGQLVGFVEAPFETVVEEMRSWKRSLGAHWREQMFEDAPLVQQLASLAPLEAPWTRELLVATQGAWTAHFSNDLGGGDSWPRVSYLGDVLAARWVVASHTPPEQYPYPSTQLWLGGPEGEPPLHFLRTVAAGIFDSGRWQFEARGPVQSWEQPARYGERRIRDRFTREMLLRYLAALGIDADEPGFYGDGVRFQERALWHWYRRPRRLSIEEARRDYARSSARP
jgi:hypothetical protein